MFDLERAVVDWRRGFAKERSFTRYDLDELEDHLRAAYEVELSLNPGLAPDRAFGYACEALGSPSAISEEFAKVGGRGWRRTVAAGWLVFATSFFLPVARHGITLGEGNLQEGLLPGVQALLLALGGWGGAIGVLSGLTNLFMLGTFWRISDAGRGRARLLAWLMTLGMVLNLCWFVLTGDRSDLYAGYYAWMASFGVVGSGLWVRARSLPDETRDPDPALAP